MNSSRMCNYKNIGKTGDVLRRRRAEASVELRKVKKQESMAKRRNIQENKNDCTTSQSFPIKTLIKPFDDISRLEFATNIRQILVENNTETITKFINSHVITILIECLSGFKCNNELQLEASWALTNLTSEDHVSTQAVVDCGAVSALVEGISNIENEEVLTQYVWTLSNIIGDEEILRDYCISCGVVDALIYLLRKFNSDLLVEVISWAFSNFYRSSCSPLDAKVAKKLFPFVEKFIYDKNADIQKNGFWTLTYFSNTFENKLGMFTPELIKHLLSVMKKGISAANFYAAMRTIGNIVIGSDSDTQMVIDADGLSVFSELVLHLEVKKTLKVEIIWILSNIAAGNISQKWRLIQIDCHLMMLTFLNDKNDKVKRESLWFIQNFLNEAVGPQVVRFLSVDFLSAVSELLKNSNTAPEILLLSLNSLYSILEAAKTHSLNFDEFCEAIETSGTLDIIEDFQISKDDKIYNSSIRLLSNFFKDANNTGDYNSLDFE